MMIEIRRRGRPTRWTETAKKWTFKMTREDFETLQRAWDQRDDKKLTFNDFCVSGIKSAAENTLARS